MAKKTPEQIQAKKEETARLVEIFKEMPIDKWAAYIKKNAPKGKQNRQYRVCAKKALSIGNMKEYIKAHDNTNEAKKAFENSTWGIQYKKINKTASSKAKEYVLDEKGEKVPLLDDSGEPLKKQSVVYAVDYFTKKYLDEKKKKKKDSTKKPFENLSNWD